MRKGTAFSKFNFEGIVSDLNSCLDLCERIGNDCIGYEMSTLTNECITFQEDFGTMTGDGNENYVCF